MRALRQKSVLVHIGRCAVGGASDVSAAICSAACSVHDTTEASSWRLDSVHGSLRAARPLVSLTGFQQPPGASLQPAAAASSERQLSTSISQQLELQQACHTVRGSHRYWPAAAAALGGGGWRGFASDSRDGDVHDQRHRAADAAAPQGSDRQSQTPPAAGRESSAASGEPSAASGSGWTRREVWNAPNAISVARLVSGPVIASWIVAGDLNAALVALVISGGFVQAAEARLLAERSSCLAAANPAASAMQVYEALEPSSCPLHASFKLTSFARSCLLCARWTSARQPAALTADSTCTAAQS